MDRKAGGRIPIEWHPRALWDALVYKSGNKIEIWKKLGKIASAGSRILQIGIHSLEFGGENRRWTMAGSAVADEDGR